MRILKIIFASFLVFASLNVTTSQAEDAKEGNASVLSATESAKAIAEKIAGKDNPSGAPGGDFKFDERTIESMLGDPMSMLDYVFGKEPQGLAYEYVAQLLGPWVKSIYTDSPSTADQVTLVTVAAGFANSIAFFGAVIALLYFSINTVINATRMGQLSQNVNSVIWPIRSSIAFALLLPAKIGGGYVSIVQLSVVWLALCGSIFADLTWNLVARKATEGVPINEPNNSLVAGKALRDMLDMVNCAKTTGDFYNRDRLDNPQNESYFSVETMRGASVSAGLKDGKDLKKLKLLKAEFDKIKSIHFGVKSQGLFSGDEGVCGTLTFRDKNTMQLSRVAT